MKYNYLENFKPLYTNKKVQLQLDFFDKSSCSWTFFISNKKSSYSWTFWLVYRGVGADFFY